MNPFSPTYAEARAKFLDAASARGAAITHYPHPGRGPADEPLALDIAVIGDPAARAVLVVGSGTHGIEGYSGSAVQTAWLRAGYSVPDGVALALFHAHNPWGFAHRERVTEENVDLNRNFIDHGVPHPANPGFAELAQALAPEHWDEPVIAEVFATLARFRAQHGEQAFSDAFNAGQYTHPESVFFGGTRAQWSNHALRAAIREHVGHARRAAMIDLHTGIGAWLDHVFFCFHAPGTPAFDRAHAWWGEKVSGKGSTHKARAVYRGLLVDAFIAELPNAETTATVIEFGTLSREAVQRASLSLAWLKKYGASDPVRARQVRTDYAETFYPSAPEWRAAVLAQSPAFINNALKGLANG